MSDEPHPFEATLRDMAEWMRKQMTVNQELEQRILKLEAALRRMERHGL